jgi:hypothetical protein
MLFLFVLHLQRAVLPKALRVAAVFSWLTLSSEAYQASWKSQQGSNDSVVCL